MPSLQRFKEADSFFEDFIDIMDDIDQVKARGAWKALEQESARFRSGGFTVTGSITHYHCEKNPLAAGSVPLMGTNGDHFKVSVRTESEEEYGFYLIRHNDGTYVVTEEWGKIGGDQGPDGFKAGYPTEEIDSVLEDIANTFVEPKEDSGEKNAEDVIKVMREKLN